MNNIEILENQIKYWKDLIKMTEESSPIYTWIKDDKIEEKTLALENLIEENKELKEEKVLNEKILYFANNTLCNYQEGYQAGLRKEITATEIVAEERERFIIGQEIKRLKDTIHELHNQLDVGNKRVKEYYIPKSKVKEKIEELEKEIEEKQENCLDFTLIHEHEIDTNGIIKVLQELLEEGE